MGESTSRVNNGFHCIYCREEAFIHAATLMGDIWANIKRGGKKSDIHGYMRCRDLTGGTTPDSGSPEPLSLPFSTY